MTVLTFNANSCRLFAEQFAGFPVDDCGMPAEMSEEETAAQQRLLQAFRFCATGAGARVHIELEPLDLPAEPESEVDPKTTIILRSSYADLYVERATGKIQRIDYQAMGGSTEWDDVDRFDPSTFPADSETDVLYVAGWLKDGTRVEPTLPADEGAE